MTHYRWGVIGLLFFAVTINYIDRAVLGILKPVLDVELGWNQKDYGWMVTAFQASYAAGYLLAGRCIDRIGVRLGFQRIAALPQFKMPDRYVNKTRPSLPAECKVSAQAETLLRVAERVILAHGGERITIDGRPGYRVRLQPPQVREPLPQKVHGPGEKP